MRQLVRRLAPALRHSIASLTLELTPFYSLTLRSGDMNRVTVRQQFDFSAAHRLHVPTLSDEENRALFGKCNNPAGHGHNYRLEVAVGAPIADDGSVLPVEAIDQLVDETVIRHLDHKHLNLDVPQFAQLNPSIENIARVIYDMLRDAVGQLHVTLEEVSVWETEKTVCTYRGE
jgi:6-pyruvoyltetrahydropterin/6-carboxytetrahydropterin synthase